MLPHTSYTASADCLNGSIDAAAEREGMALQWMIQNGLTEGYSILADRVIVRDQRYPTMKAVRAHVKIADAENVGELMRMSQRIIKGFEICTPRDRARRKLVKRARLARARALKRNPTKLLTAAEASKASLFATRTLSKWIQCGRLPRIGEQKHMRILAGDLAAAVFRKLRVAA